MKNSALVNMNCDWDMAVPTREYFDELFRISENQIIWGGNYFDLPPTRCVVCWDKVQPWPNFSQWEMAWTSFDRPAKLFRHSNTGGHQDFGKIHPTQKPVRLYRYLLKEFALPGDNIIDTHLGSGMIRIAADEMGFDFTGIEIDPGYFSAQEKSFSNYKKQLTLF